MGKMVSSVFAKFVQQVRAGRITNEHLLALMADPDRAIDRGVALEVVRFLGLIPKAYDDVLCLTLADGHPLYRAQRGSERFIVHGTTEGKAYDDVGNPTLADGHPLYCARRGSEWFIVHGTTEGKAYDEIFSLRVQEGDDIEYGARKGRKLLRVTRRLHQVA